MSRRRIGYQATHEGTGFTSRPALWNPVTNRFIHNTSRNRRSIIRQLDRERTLVLISCSSQKAWDAQMEDPRRVLQGHTTAASNAYCSPLFSKSRAWAERRGYPWAVLSAKYGLISPNQEIDDYDLTLRQFTPAQRREWGRVVVHTLDKLEADLWTTTDGPAPAPPTIVMAGEAYTAPMRAAGAHIEEPLKGKQIGERLSWLNADESRFPDFALGGGEPS
jgi:hypothetical protein